MDKKGSVLMISLWILAILVVFALGLGHRASINLRLARYQRDRLKALYLAKAGINRAIVELEKDTNGYDTSNEKWADNKEIFEKIVLKEELEENPVEFATVSYKVKDQSTAEEEAIYGVIDEERKININTASPELLLTLFKEFNIEETQAQEMVNYIRVWRGEQSQDLPVITDFKKMPFANTNELLLVLEYFYQTKGDKDYLKKGQGIYKNIEDLITVCPIDKININTASGVTLTILAKAVTDLQQQQFITTLISQILNFRYGNNEPFNSDDTINQFVSSKTEEQNIFDGMKPSLGCKSNYFRIESMGKIEDISKKIIAIYNRRGQDKKIVYWHEN